VVITGMGVVSPLGNSLEQLWHGLLAGRSGVQRLPSVSGHPPAVPFGGLATEFSGTIDDFGPLDRERQKAIRKGLKLMCREIRMGVAAAQLAWHQAGFATAAHHDPDRSGVVFGCDHIVTIPEDFSEAFRACVAAEPQFGMEQWARVGMPQVTPLWLLKYLPNMPASHVAIYNDLRGPNNSLTYREPSANLALAEGATTIRRGAADCMVIGASGSSLGPLRCLQCALQTELAWQADDPAAACRPFDRDRSGAVPGEGAAAVVLECRDHALQRDAPIWAEVVAHGSSVVANRDSVADLRQAARNALQLTLRSGQIPTQEVGHLHAHGLGTRHADREEARAIRDVFGAATDRLPVVAAKSYFGNLGAASGMVELISSLLALAHGQLFPVRNCQSPDPECPIRPVTDDRFKPGHSVLNLNFSPVGQASAVYLRAPDQP
jgi:3-oxoacyl-[acyl-carrier-protein] synthase II